MAEAGVQQRGEQQAGEPRRRHQGTHRSWGVRVYPAQTDEMTIELIIMLVTAGPPIGWERNGRSRRARLLIGESTQSAARSSVTLRS